MKWGVPAELMQSLGIWSPCHGIDASSPYFGLTQTLRCSHTPHGAQHVQDIGLGGSIQLVGPAYRPLSGTC